MSQDISDLADVIETGWPPVELVACKVCGVLLWDAPSHYRHAHPISCVVDGCTHTFIRRSELNAHSREHHRESNPFGFGERYPGVTDGGDVRWFSTVEAEQNR